MNSDIRKFTQIHIIIALVQFVLLIGPGLPHAHSDPLDNTITMGLPLPDWPPYVIVKQDQIHGIIVDVFKEICATKGFTPHFESHPDKRAYILLENGKIDVWPDARAWVAHPERYLWSGDIFQCEDLLISQKEKPIVFNQIEDLFGKTIATQYDYVYPGLDEYFNRGRIQRVDTRGNIPMLKMVLMGRADAGVINKWVALWELKNSSQLEVTDFTFSKKSVGRAGYGLLFSKTDDWRPFAKAFRVELEIMKQNGRFNQIISQYR